MNQTINSYYRISEEVLRDIFFQIRSFIEGNGGQVEFVDLENVIERQIYQFPGEASADEHHETALSNGHIIYLHEDLDEIGMAARVYDLFHVGLGHYWQWNSKKESGFSFYGDFAWEIGTQSFYGRSSDQLKIVKAYEAEAGMVALSNLKKVFASSNLPLEEQVKIWNFLNDYVQTDLDYIITYYTTGNLPSIASVWKFETPKLPAIQVKSPIFPYVRASKCVPLIRGRC